METKECIFMIGAAYHYSLQALWAKRGKKNAANREQTFLLYIGRSCNKREKKRGGGWRKKMREMIDIP